MRRLIIGWGNPLAGDDALGWKAAELVQKRIDGVGDVEVAATALGALRVAERMLGYDRVIVLDAAAGPDRNGVIRTELRPHEMDAADEPIGHDGSLVDAIRALRRLHADGLPEEIVLLAAPIQAPRAWDDRLSTTTEAAAARLAQAALEELEGIPVA